MSPKLCSEQTHNLSHPDKTHHSKHPQSPHHLVGSRLSELKAEFQNDTQQHAQQQGFIAAPRGVSCLPQPAPGNGEDLPAHILRGPASDVKDRAGLGCGGGQHSTTDLCTPVTSQNDFPCATVHSEAQKHRLIRWSSIQEEHPGVSASL